MRKKDEATKHIDVNKLDVNTGYSGIRQFKIGFQLGTVSEQACVGRIASAIHNSIQSSGESMENE